MNFVYSQKWPNIPCPSCYRLFEFIYWNQIPIELEGVAVGRWLGYEGGARMNEINILTKETPEIPPLLSLPCEDKQEDAVWEPGNRLSLDTESWVSKPPDL